MSTDITLVGLRIDGVELDIQTLVDQQTDARQDINEIFPRLGNVENVAANNRWRIENIEDGVEGLVPLFQYLLGVQYTSFDGSLNALSGEIAENNGVIQAAMAAAATAEQGYQDNRDYIDEISFESRQAVTQEIYEELAVFQNSVDGQILSSENTLSTQIDGVTSYIADNLYTRVDTDTAISLSQTELLSELAQNNVTLGAEFNEIFYTRTSVDGAVATALTTARAEYSDALVDINGTIDGIKSLDVDVIGGTAIGNTIEDLTVRANSATASISTQGTAIATLNDGASAGYLIRAQAGNSVSLIDLVAADGSSQTPGSFAKIEADNILLQGSVKARHLTVTEQLISSSAQLGTAVISSAKIGDLEVGRAKIGNNAANEVISFSFYNYSMPTGTATWNQFQDSFNTWNQPNTGSYFDVPFTLNHSGNSSTYADVIAICTIQPAMSFTGDEISYSALQIGQNTNFITGGFVEDELRQNGRTIAGGRAAVVSYSFPWYYNNNTIRVKMGASIKMADANNSGQHGFKFSGYVWIRYR